MNWIPIDHLSDKDFMDYLRTLPENFRAPELQRHTKSKATQILKDEMSKHTNFYSFIKKYSPKDYKLINSKGHVSQRVLLNHVNMWNEIHPNNEVKHIRVFFY